MVSAACSGTQDGHLEVLPLPALLIGPEEGEADSAVRLRQVGNVDVLDSQDRRRRRRILDALPVVPRPAETKRRLGLDAKEEPLTDGGDLPAALPDLDVSVGASAGEIADETSWECAVTNSANR